MFAALSSAVETVAAFAASQEQCLRIAGTSSMWAMEKQSASDPRLLVKCSASNIGAEQKPKILNIPLHHNALIGSVTPDTS